MKSILEFSEKSFLKSFISNAKGLARNLQYILITLFTTVLTYGYVVFNRGLSTDDFDSARFLSDGHAYIAAGRFSMPSINWLLNNVHYNVYFYFATAIIVFFIATLFFVAFIKTITEIDNDYILGLLGALFISTPVIAYIFTYLLATLTITIGYLIAIFACVLAIEFLLTKKLKYLIADIILLVFLIALYESFVFVFIIIFAFILLFDINNFSKLKVRSFLKCFAGLIIIILTACVLKYITQNIIMSLMHVQSSGYVSLGKSLWQFNSTFFITLKEMIYGIFMEFYFIGLYSFSSFCFVIFSILLIVISLLHKSKKKIQSVLASILVIVSLFGISYILGSVQLARSLQTQSVFMMFAAAFIYLSILQIRNIKVMKSVRIAFVIIIFLVIFYNTQEQNNYYSMTYNQYNYDKNIATKIGNDIESEYGVGNNCYFYGQIPIHSKNEGELYIVNKKDIRGQIYYKLDQMFNDGKKTNSNIVNYKQYYEKGGYFTSASYINGIYPSKAAQPTKQVYMTKYLQHLGFDVNQCSKTTLKSIDIPKEASELSVYPKKGYFKKINGCVIVRLS